MTANELYAMLPLLVLTGAVILLLLIASFYRSHTLTVIITALIFAGTFISLFFTPGKRGFSAESLIVLDGFSLFYMGLLLAGAFTVTLFSYGYFKTRPVRAPEFYLLLILATTGASVLGASRNFVAFFLGLEILSVSLYAMIGYMRANAHSIEAGVKYLILAAVSSAFLLFGMALIYAESGTMRFDGILQWLMDNKGPTPLLYSGMGLLVVGIGFKLAIVPFHMWTPDVYQGAPAPVSAYIATVSKGAVMALAVRYFYSIKVSQYESLMLVFGILSVASMFVGNLLALRQNNVKRILAYSSISHLGYLLVAFCAGGGLAVEAIAFYLVAYFATVLVAFGTIALHSGSGRDADRIEDYRGLFWKQPWVAAALSAALLSLAGIPLTAGFLGKYYVALAGISAGLWVLVLMLVINSAISLYYYLRIMAVMYAQPDEKESLADSGASFSYPGGAVLALLTLLIILIGVYPAPLIDLIKVLMAGAI